MGVLRSRGRMAPPCLRYLWTIIYSFTSGPSSICATERGWVRSGGTRPRFPRTARRSRRHPRPLTLDVRNRIPAHAWSLPPQPVLEGKSQLAGGHDNHEWQRMRRWGYKALPLPRWKRSGRGDRGLPGPLLRHPVPALLLHPEATTCRGPPQRGVGPMRIATILHLHNGSRKLGPSNSRRRGGVQQRTEPECEGGGK